MIDFPKDSRERELRLLIERAKYERWVAERVAELVEREFNRVLDLLLSAEYRNLTVFQRRRAAALFRELDRLIRAGYATVAEFQVKQAQGYAQLEADVARASVSAVLSVGVTEAASAAATVRRVAFPRLPRSYLDAIAKLPVQGLRIGEWYDGQAAKMSLRTRQVIQQGLVEGKPPTEISRRILAPERAAAQAGAPPVSSQAKREAKIIARTTVSAVQADATTVSNSALPRSISDSYMLVAVRDRRTSVICRAKDGLVYKYDDARAEHPPFHLGGCRTTERALLKGADLTLTAQKVPPSMRGYSEWLRAQPQAVQNDILGPTRATWFREGKMTLADAIDADNRVLTLPQLREKLGLTDMVRS